MINKGATTMTVREMGGLLGLKKTASYYLVHKKVFESVLIAGRIRIVKASFEDWYTHQDKYRKMSGTPPGAMLRADLYSIRDIASMLMLSKERARELVCREKLKVRMIDGKHWISRDDFDGWYASQTQYRNAEDRARDRPTEENSVTVPDMGRLLGLDRRKAWKLYYKDKGALELIRIAGKPRITLVSFATWYMNQSEYCLSPVVRSLSCEPAKRYIRPQEAAVMLGINVQSIYRMLQQQKLKGKKIGRAWYIRYIDMLSKQ